MFGSAHITINRKWGGNVVWYEYRLTIEVRIQPFVSHIQMDYKKDPFASRRSANIIPESAVATLRQCYIYQGLRSTKHYHFCVPRSLTFNKDSPPPPLYKPDLPVIILGVHQRFTERELDNAQWTPFPLGVESKALNPLCTQVVAATDQDISFFPTFLGSVCV